MWRRAVGLLVSALAVLVAVALTAGVVTPPHRGTVTGGIIPCHALDDPKLPHYAGGTVYVLKGDVTGDVLPQDVAAHATVSTNGMYRFDLEPGDYVLLAAAQARDRGPYTTVSLSAGDDLLVDIPNRCI